MTKKSPNKRMTLPQKVSRLIRDVNMLKGQVGDWAKDMKDLRAALEASEKNHQVHMHNARILQRAHDELSDRFFGLLEQLRSSGSSAEATLSDENLLEATKKVRAARKARERELLQQQEEHQKEAEEQLQDPPEDTDKRGVPGGAVVFGD